MKRKNKVKRIDVKKKKGEGGGTKTHLGLIKHNGPHGKSVLLELGLPKRKMKGYIHEVSHWQR